MVGGVEEIGQEIVRVLGERVRARVRLDPEASPAREDGDAVGRERRAHGRPPHLAHEAALHAVEVRFVRARAARDRAAGQLLVDLLPHGGLLGGEAAVPGELVDHVPGGRPARAHAGAVGHLERAGRLIVARRPAPGLDALDGDPRQAAAGHDDRALDRARLPAAGQDHVSW